MSPVAPPNLYWIPAHIGVEGNEEADVLAEAGAEWGREEEKRREERLAKARAAKSAVEMPRIVMDESLTSFEDTNEWVEDQRSEEV
ncbi:hypothetical protein JCM8097_007500, partial [Rhodosporidiobolus ruineniae]